MKTIKVAIVMHDGWEMDNEAWVKRDDNIAGRVLQGN